MLYLRNLFWMHLLSNQPATLILKMGESTIHLLGWTKMLNFRRMKVQRSLVHLSFLLNFYLSVKIFQTDVLCLSEWVMAYQPPIFFLVIMMHTNSHVDFTLIAVPLWILSISYFTNGWSQITLTLLIPMNILMMQTLFGSLFYQEPLTLMTQKNLNLVISLRLSLIKLVILKLMELLWRLALY